MNCPGGLLGSGQARKAGRRLPGWLPRLRRLAKPVIAVGTMSLTAYVGHFVAQSVLSTPAGTVTQQSWVPLPR
nr:hypothetical protein [Streptomyces bicolor]